MQLFTDFLNNNRINLLQKIDNNFVNDQYDTQEAIQKIVEKKNLLLKGAGKLFYVLKLFWQVTD